MRFSRSNDSVLTDHAPSANGARGPKARTESTSDSRSNAIVANARREFASAFGDLARGKRNWQLVAFTAVAIAAALALSVLRLAALAHPIPYVVQVDRLGTVTAVQSAEQLREPDARLVASQLASFLRAVRTVLPTAAATAQADMLRRGYAFTTPAAAAFLNAYFSDAAHDPRLLGARLARDVQVTSALRVPDPPNAGHMSRRGQTWRLEWLETDRPLGPLDGADSVAVTAWEGYVTLEIIPPRSVEAIQDNPLGLRITSIAWTRVAGQAVPRDSVRALTNSSHDGGVR